MVEPRAADADAVADGLPAGAWSEAERLAGATFTSVERVARGYSRASYRAVTADGARYAIRVAPADGPMTGTELDLANEAAHLRALAGTGLPVPHVYGVAADGSFVVTDWLPGRTGVDDLTDDQRSHVYLRYVHALAALHGTDVSTLSLPARDDELTRWVRVLDAKVRRPRPLAWFGLAVLERHRPPLPDRLAVCHGDPGPGNFLHEDGEITALLDWEFVHVGDPVDDLAWWSFRGHDLTGGCGDLDEQLTAWTAATGRDVPADVFAYYRALAALRFYISLVVMLEVGGGAVDRAVPLRVLGRVNLALPRLLAEACGHPLPPAEVVAVPPAEVGGDAVRVLRHTLAEVALPSATTREVRRRLVNALPLLEHIERCLASGPAVAAARRAEVEALTGGPVDDPDRALLDLVGDAEREGALLEHFWRTGCREQALWEGTW